MVMETVKFEFLWIIMVLRKFFEYELKIKIQQLMISKSRSQSLKPSNLNNYDFL